MSARVAVPTPVFAGTLAPFATIFVRAGEVTPAGFGPLDRASVAEQVDRFQRSVGSARPPACSFWAQFYFNALLIPAVCLLRGNAGASCVPMAAEFCPASGTPLHLLIRDQDASRPACAAAALLDHVDAMIDDLHAVGRLSKRMLWESAERAATWTLGQIGLEDPAGADLVATLFHEARPARSPFTPRRGSGPEAVRRSCCLRYHLPGAPACGAACPRRTADALPRSAPRSMASAEPAASCRT